MIGREPEAAASASHDLVIVGAGVYGITLALEAARRGLKPLLLDRGDFGGATSWNSLRIVHGGLRYLQTFDLKRFRESVRERSWLLRCFPDQVQLLPCLMPLHGDGLKRPAVLRAALGLNDMLSAARNRGVREDRRLPASRVLSADETRRAFPQVRRAGLLGAAHWYDAVMPASQRLLMELLHWAVACGAQALNYVEVEQLLHAGGRVAGVRASDRTSGRSYEFRAPRAVNTAGPWSRNLAAVFDRDVPELFRPSVAINAVIDRKPLSTHAVAVAPPPAGSRTYFLHPWKGRIFAGTHHAVWTGSLDAESPGEPQVEAFLDGLNQSIPGFEVQRSDVLRLHWGLLPALRTESDQLAVREVIHDHGSHGGPRGLYSVSGVKFTTARSVAEKTLRVMGARSPVGGTPRPPAHRIPDAADLTNRLEAGTERLRAEVLELVHGESVVYPEDLLLRRTDWGLEPHKAAAIEAGLRALLGPNPPWCAGSASG